MPTLEVYTLVERRRRRMGRWDRQPRPFYLELRSIGWMKVPFIDRDRFRLTIPICPKAAIWHEQDQVIALPQITTAYSEFNLHDVRNSRGEMKRAVVVKTEQIEFLQKYKLLRKTQWSANLS